MNSLLYLLILNFITVAKAICAHNMNDGYHLVKHGYRISDLDMIAQANLTSFEQCMLYARYKRGLSFSYNSPVCIVALCPVLETLVEDPEFQHFSKFLSSVLVLPRKKLELRNEAVPSIFPNLPNYLSCGTRSERRKPEDRKQEYVDRENDKYSQWLLDDQISSLDDITQNTHRFNCSNWMIKKHKEQIFFFKLHFDDSVSVTTVLTLKSDFNVFISSDNTSIDPKKFSWILGTSLKCNTYAKLENLLSALNNLDPSKVDIKDKINKVQEILNECIELSEDENMKSGLQFISEQLQLQISKQHRYSSDILLNSCCFFFSFPAAYRFLRSMNILILPHPSHLKTFNLSSINGGINDSLKKYLEAKCNALDEHEKLVCLLLDEIYVKPKITYRGNKIFGFAGNSDDMKAATTIQTFMIRSVLCKNKDVIALLPVKNLDAEFLCKSTLLVLSLLHNIGFRVVCIISDNNKVNVKMYKMLCNDTVIKPCIPHPNDLSQMLFLLFDTVHLFKNLRNNWINEKCKTFIYPSMHDAASIKQCEFRHIRELYEAEKNSLVKHAPGISYKVCYPNNLERQNVSYVVPLFDDKTITALTLLLPDSQGTSEWLQNIRNWWLTVNVKHPYKGVHTRQPQADPIRNMDQDNIVYLKSFCTWLESWNDIIIIDYPKQCGKLSKETYMALLHTTQTLILLCEHLLQTEKLHYVLLGNFQTDDLEERFGKYRRMSGCNYNVSVQQVIESERKLKVTSLLKMRNNKHEFSVSDLIRQINSAQCNIDKDLLLFPESDKFLAECATLEINSSTLQIITFLSGYVSFKVCGNLLCQDCKSTLITDKDLIYELPEEAAYLKHLDRGGLKYPSEISVDLGVQTFQIFECLISSKKYEKEFIHSSNQKALIKALVLEVIELRYSTDVQCICGLLFLDMADMCINIWINILLNNYSKMNTNLFSEKSLSSSVQIDTSGNPAKRYRKLSILKNT